MYKFIETFKKIFIRFLSFSGSLATKYMLLNSEQCKTRSFFIDSNPVILLRLLLINVTEVVIPLAKYL